LNNQSQNEKALKTIYTSCYGRAKFFPKGAIPIRTSTSKPDWWIGELRVIKEFIPRSFGKGLTETQWKSDYRAQMGLLWKSGRLEEIVESIPEGAVLLCYEGDWRACHRSVLAEILTAKGLSVVTELKAEKPETVKPVDPQLSFL
jgi:hypothetical protein